jgi:hypothetical protein
MRKAAPPSPLAVVLDHKNEGPRGEEKEDWCGGSLLPGRAMATDPRWSPRRHNAVRLRTVRNRSQIDTSRPL